eukprot:5116400-Amphidinium_carterae.1
MVATWQLRLTRAHHLEEPATGKQQPHPLSHNKESGEAPATTSRAAWARGDVDNPQPKHPPT